MGRASASELAIVGGSRRCARRNDLIRSLQFGRASPAFGLTLGLTSCFLRVGDHFGGEPYVKQPRRRACETPCREHRRGGERHSDGRIGPPKKKPTFMRMKRVVVVLRVTVTRFFIVVVEAGAGAKFGPPGRVADDRTSRGRALRLRGSTTGGSGWDPQPCWSC